MKGSIQLMNADYDGASASFANSAKSDVVTFDTGLNQLLNGD